MWTIAPLTFSLVQLCPLSFPVWISTGLCIYTVCNRGEGGDRVVWRAYTGVIQCVFDQVPNLQNCFITSNKNLGGEGHQTDKYLPQSPFTGKFFKKSRHLGLESVSYFVHARRHCLSYSFCVCVNTSGTTAKTSGSLPFLIFFSVMLIMWTFWHNFIGIIFHWRW